MTNIYLNDMPATAAKISPDPRLGVNICKSSVYKTTNFLKTRTKRAFALLLLLALLAPAAAWAQNPPNPFEGQYRITTEREPSDKGYLTIMPYSASGYYEPGTQITVIVEDESQSGVYGSDKLLRLLVEGISVTVSHSMLSGSMTGMEYQFTMPERDVHIKAIYNGAPYYTITKSCEPDYGGTIDGYGWSY